LAHCRSSTESTVAQPQSRCRSSDGYRGSARRIGNGAYAITLDIFGEPSRFALSVQKRTPISW
jgi:hypothetical protein